MKRLSAPGRRGSSVKTSFKPDTDTAALISSIGTKDQTPIETKTSNQSKAEIDGDKGQSIDDSSFTTRVRMGYFI